MSTKNTQLVKVTILVTDDPKVQSTPIRNAWVTLTLRGKESDEQARQKSKTKGSVEEYSDDYSCEEKVYRKETNSTLSDYIIHLFQDRHSGRDCRTR